MSDSTEQPKRQSKKLEKPRRHNLQNNRCRMYEQKDPKPNELVVVRVKEVTQMGAYVELLEYDNREGLIQLSELSRRRFRSIQRLIRVDKEETVLVTGVDAEKGYVDLSKRRVVAEAVAQANQKYVKSKAVHSIVHHVSETVGVYMIQIYEGFVWDLYKRYGHAYDALKLCVKDHETVLEPYAEWFEKHPGVKEQLLATVNHRLTPQPIKVRADIELNCFAFEGIDAIKDALIAGELGGDKVKIRLVAPPLYVLLTTADSDAEGIQLLEKSIAAITETIRSKQGDINVKVAPRVVSTKDDQALDKLMEKLEKENQQISGDDDRE